jgi:putative transposase
MIVAKDLSMKTNIQAACSVLGIPRATYYRRWSDKAKPRGSTPLRKHPLALSEIERQRVLNTLRSKRFVDKSPGEIVPILLDEGVYLCSERTMYRILKDASEIRERRQRAAQSHFKKPELLALGPNEVWSWDITKLKGSRKWSYYYLYVILDIYSRYVVGWMVADRESAELAKRLISKACEKQNIQPNQLTLHADRGTSMKSKAVAYLLADLGVTKTHSRPYTSDDNPYSESQFKTLKYCPQFPERFGCIEDANVFCRAFFRWYNDEHRHSGINRLTPKSLHQGFAKAVLEKRERVLEKAFSDHPERFKNKKPTGGKLPEKVWINPPAKVEVDENKEGEKKVA